MAELGEGVAVISPVPATAEKGDLKVKVIDICTGDAIKDAEVIVGGNKKNTDSSGGVTYTGLSVGLVSIQVKIHFKDVDYSTFIIHYPKVLNNHEAKSAGSDLVSIVSGGEELSEIELKVFKSVGDIVFHRRHIDMNGEDKYGHWWTVVNATTSFGWWPKYPMGDPRNSTSILPTPPQPPPTDPSLGQQIQYMFASAVFSAKSSIYSMRESGLGQTFGGVDGSLNGLEFGGTKTQDPHHLMGDEGDEQYQSVRSDCFIVADIENNISLFAQSYSGGWSWRFEGGNHCHTFQKKLMKDLKLDNVKVLK